MGLIDSIQTAWGIARSVVMYYGVLPFRAGKQARFYARFIRPGDLCFDVGAHVGSRIRIWLELGAQVVAIEPQPGLMRLLRRWYGRDPRVKLVEVAVGAASGQAELLISRRTPTVTTLSRTWADAVRRSKSFVGVKWDDATSIHVMTLDALITEHGRPAFVKIDVEGYEWEVLKGLSSPVSALSFEYIPAALDLALGCLEQLGELGDYRFNRTIGERMRFESEWVGAEAMAAQLRAIPADGPSGDVYAQLVGALP